MDKKLKCNECKYYYKLDESCGLCRLWIPQLRVSKEGSCKHGKLKEE